MPTNASQRKRAGRITRSEQPVLLADAGDTALTPTQVAALLPTEPEAVVYPPDARPYRMTADDDLFVRLPFVFDYQGVTGVVGVSGGQAAIVQLSFADPHGIDGNTLRRVAPGQMLAELLQGEAQLLVDGDFVSVGEALTLSERDQLRIRVHGPTEDTLRRVAMVYRLAAALKIPPAAYVAAHLGVPMSTTGTWIRRCRDLGLLPEVSR
jgi:hypothetical protein